MSETGTNRSMQLDRYTRIGELGDALHRFLKTAIPLIAVATVLLSLKLFFTGTPGWLAIIWMGAGLCIALVSWHGAGIGLPLLPLLAVQHFATYAVPLINRNEAIKGYTESQFNHAGLQVLVLLVVSSAAWRTGMKFFSPSPPTAHAFRMIVTEGNRALNRIGLLLIITAAGYELLNALHLTTQLLAVLPSGTQSIVVAIMGAAGMAGYFLVAMFIANGAAPRSTRNIFWIVLAGHLFLITASILLSSVINIIGAVCIGLFWGSGRFPRMFLFVCALVLSFLNIGKFEMRERYWIGSGQVSANVTLASLPGYYMEWAGYSWDMMTSNREEAFPDPKESKRQTMLARMDNMQNLLFVADRIGSGTIQPLGGETYAIIPPLLIPRIFWPEKPRSHEGQVLLNVHFGRQSREDSFGTYIAWGLLPEAYGNFGPFWGAAILGVFLGFAFAALENLTARKPLLSMEGMITLVLLIGIASSFEMVASVLVTSLFQAVLTVIMACFPFVQSMTSVRPEPETE